MIAEVLLAACALLVWRFTQPGTVHDLALYTAVACSVATIVVNANPLLRYDGYFILADFVGIVNMGEQSTLALRKLVTDWLFGDLVDDDRAAPVRFRKRLALYAVASVIYRWVLTVAVLWWVRKLLAPHGLTPLADVLTVVTVASMLVGPIRGAALIVKAWQGQTPENRFRASAKIFGVVLLIVALLSWPWSYDVSAPAVVRLKDAEYVYVVVGGTLVEAVAPSDEVKAGDVFAQPSRSEDRVRSRAIAVRGRSSAVGD